jgi:hypothetical protein
MFMETFRILGSVTGGRERKQLGCLFAALFLLLLAAKLCHIHILWAEEGYSSAAAVQILHGKMLYRDFWFDKPPLAALVYALWGGGPGFWLRFAGAVYAAGCCLAAYWFAMRRWSRREGISAALLMAFYLIFDIPASVMTLGPDLLMLLPAIAALDCAGRKSVFRSGLWCSVALATNAKALLILAVCFVWASAGWLPLVAGFVIGTAPWFVWLAAVHALPEYWRQVWWFGAEYSRHTFVRNPMREAILRTLNWAGFHAAIVLAAALFFWREQKWKEYGWVAWLLLACAGVWAGERFFLRYYFILLPPVLLLGAAGFVRARRVERVLLSMLLLIPAIRFAPRYFELADSLLAGRRHPWADTALNRDSQRVAEEIDSLSKPGDTLLVWGYRPDVFAYTQLPVAGRFLDSQLYTGVIADRHLFSTQVTFPVFAARNRAELVRTRPAFIVDGLGKLNPALAITQYSDLREWLAGYKPVFQTSASTVYMPATARGAGSQPAASRLVSTSRRTSIRRLDFGHLQPFTACSRSQIAILPPQSVSAANFLSAEGGTWHRE